jgi:hypothetical protein
MNVLNLREERVSDKSRTSPSAVATFLTSSSSVPQAATFGLYGSLRRCSSINRFSMPHPTRIPLRATSAETGQTRERDQRAERVSSTPDSGRDRSSTEVGRLMPEAVVIGYDGPALLAG